MYTSKTATIINTSASSSPNSSIVIVAALFVRRGMLTTCARSSAARVHLSRVTCHSALRFLGAVEPLVEIAKLPGLRVVVVGHGL